MQPEQAEGDAWTLADFDESEGLRPSDGLQMELWDYYYRAENVGAPVDGTVVGVRFYQGDPIGVYPSFGEDQSNRIVPLTDKMVRYYKNMLNMVTEWTGGCIRFVDVTHPAYQHRISQNLVTFNALQIWHTAYAAGGGAGGGCSVNNPYWARVEDNIIMHEFFHCMGLPHELDRSDKYKECITPLTPWEEGNYFTRFDYLSVMATGERCGELKNAQDPSLPMHEMRISSTYDVVDVMNKCEGRGKCDRNVFKAMAESQTCGSKGPLPFNYPFLDQRRCDMAFDCPYEDIGADSSKVDEGAHCMEHCLFTTTVTLTVITVDIFRLW